MFSKKLQKLSLWLTFSAILSVSLMPTVSRLVFKQDIPMPGMVQASQVSENHHAHTDCHSAKDSDNAPSGHCLFCFIPGCPFELKSVAIVSLLLRAESLSPPLYALSVQYVQPIWEPNRARAPPAFL